MDGEVGSKYEADVLPMESRRMMGCDIVGLGGRTMEPRRGVDLVMSGDPAGERGLPGVATDGDGGGLGRCSGGMTTLSSRRSDGAAIELAKASSLGNGASKATFTLYIDLSVRSGLLKT